MNMTPRPLVQDLVKQAMVNASQRAQIAAEGARRMKVAEEVCSSCDESPCKCTESKKKESSAVSTDYALKLAAAIEYATPAVVHMSKRASGVPEGVTASNVSGTMPGPGQQGKGHMQPPTSPGVQKALPQEQGATQLENTIDEHVPGVQGTAMTAGQGKTASVYAKNLRKLARVMKIAGEPLTPGIDELAGRLAARRDAPPVNLDDVLAGHQVHMTPAPAEQLAFSMGSEGISPKSISVQGTAPVAAVEQAAAKAAPAAAVEQAAAKTAPAAEEAAAKGLRKYLTMRTAGIAGGTALGLGALGLGAKALYDSNKEASLKLAAENLYALKKQAEDAINPAQISAGPAVPPETSASGESGGAPVGGMPQGPHSLVHSNESAINYKRQAAYAPRKSELAQYFNEPALSSATDKTLNEAFAHTSEAGVKISSAQLLKSAAIRALLAKMASEKDSSLETVSRAAGGLGKFIENAKKVPGGAIHSVPRPGMSAGKFTGLKAPASVPRPGRPSVMP